MFRAGRRPPPTRALDPPPLPHRLRFTVPLAGPFGALLVGAMLLAGLD